MASKLVKTPRETSEQKRIAYIAKEKPDAKKRRENIQVLQRRLKLTPGEMAKLMGMNSTFCSMTIGENFHRPIPDAVARTLEVNLGLKTGEVDSDAPTGVAPSPKVVLVPASADPFSPMVNSKLLTAAMSAVMTAASGADCSPRKLAELTALVMCDAEEHGGEVRDMFVKRIVATLVEA